MYYRLINLILCGVIHPIFLLTRLFFLVVIDHAQMPTTKTGKFECVYRQITTPVNQNKFVLQGQKLPLSFFCYKTESKDVKVISFLLNNLI